MWRRVLCVMALLVAGGSGQYVLEAVCPEPCRCHTASVARIFSIMFAVREVIMNCSSSGLSALPSPPAHEVYALLLAGNNFTQLSARCFAEQMMGSSLKELDLRDNQITVVDPDALEGLGELSSLALDRNRITSLPARLFAHCPVIAQVSLSGNPLLLPAHGPFLSAGSLLVLQLANCSLEAIPEETFSEMTGLRLLVLSDNPDLQEVPMSALSPLRLLQGLVASRAPRLRLTGSGSLPVRELAASGACALLRQDSRMPRLTQLAARDCGLPRLPSLAEAAAGTLDTLVLSNNNLSTWNSSLHMPSLGFLALDSNNFTRLDPSWFSGLRSLGLLHLSGNPLQVPEASPLLNAPHLHALLLANCSLRVLYNESLSNLTALAALDLAANGLQELPPGLFAALTELVQLDLSDNELRNLPEGLFTENRRLRELDLSGNHLLSPLQRLPAAPGLTALYLSRMRLDSVPASWLLQYPHLVNLSLANNNISTVSVSSLETLQELTLVSLRANPLRCDAALQPFYRWSQERHLVVLATCAQPRGNWQLMEHLHFDEVTAPTVETTTPTTEQSTSTVNSATTQVRPQPAAVSATPASGGVSLWLILVGGLLLGAVLGAVLLALAFRRLRLLPRSGFLPVRLRDTASAAEDYGDQVLLAP